MDAKRSATPMNYSLMSGETSTTCEDDRNEVLWWYRDDVDSGLVERQRDDELSIENGRHSWLAKKLGGSKRGETFPIIII